MVSLDPVTIDPVPPESPTQTDPFPALDPINTFNLVGPTAANRQPNALKQRDFTLRDRVNLLVANMNYISTGEGSAVLFLPRDGTNPMTGDLNMGGKKITSLLAGTADSDAIRKDQVVENRLWATPTATPDDYVQVSAGTYQKTDGTGYVTFAGGSVQITTSVGGGQTRYDLVHIDDSVGGTLGVTQGVAGTPGTVPEFPDDKLMLAVVKVDETGTIVVDQADITDVRPILAADQNARALQATPVDVTTPNVDEILQYDGSKWVPSAVAGAPTNYIGGLITSNNGSDSAHDIDIAKGQCRDVDDTVNMVLAALLTKRIDAVWAVGSGNGGLDTGAVAANTLYAIWLIKRVDTGVVDALFSTSFTSPSMPTDYTKKRLIAAVRTESGSDILAYIQSGDYFRYMGNVITDVNDTITNQVWEVGTLSVPPSCLAHIYANLGNTSETVAYGRVHVRTNGAADDSATNWEAFAAVIMGGSTFDSVAGIGAVLVDASQQVQYAGSEVTDGAVVGISTFGFWMLTRREP